MPSPQGWGIRTWVRAHSVARGLLLAQSDTDVQNSMTNLNVDSQKKFHLATELRDNIDLFCQGSTYAVFLKKLWPVFQKMLEGPPAFMSASFEHVSPIGSSSPRPRHANRLTETSQLRT